MALSTPLTMRKIEIGGEVNVTFSQESIPTSSIAVKEKSTTTRHINLIEKSELFDGENKLVRMDHSPIQQTFEFGK